jgi:hypothetical protein
MINQDFRAKLYFSLTRSFLGKIDSRLRAIQMKYDGDQIRIFCYFDGKITSDDMEEISEVEDGIISDFCTPYNEITVLCECERLDAPAELPWDKTTEWFYLRKEKSSIQCG